MEFDLVQQIEKKISDLNIAIRSLRKTGTEYAEAERAYKLALAKKVYELKQASIPATLIQLVVYGDDVVAEKRKERDIAEAVYRANLESINAIKLEIRILDNQISREWSNVSNET